MKQGKSSKEQKQGKSKDKSNAKKTNTRHTNKSVSYVPKAHKETESPSDGVSPLAETHSPISPNKIDELFSSATHEVQLVAPIARGALTKEIMLGLYKKEVKTELIEESIKLIKEVYSEEPILPEGKKEFQKDMSKSIMPPRKAGTQYKQDGSAPEPKLQYETFRTTKRAGEIDGDGGIVLGSEGFHENFANAPIWFNEKGTEKQRDDSELEDDDGQFMFKGISGKQLSLEEEKAKFHADNPGVNNALPHPKAPSIDPSTIESILKKFTEDGGFSSVDEKYEKAVQKSKIAEELFTSSTISSIPGQDTSKISAIDVSTLEANLLKASKPESKESEESEGEMPLWDGVNSDEVKQHTQKHLEDWGFTLNQDKDSLMKDTGIPRDSSKKAKEESEIFSRLNMTETAPVEMIKQKSIQDKQIPLAAPAIDLSKSASTAPIPSSNSLKDARHIDNLFDSTGPSIIPPPINNENKNPFCHSSLRIKETDKIWFYMDLQGQLQGPFTSIEMYMWNKGGYFPGELMVRCGEILQFTQLSEFLASLQTRPAFGPPPMLGPDSKLYRGYNPYPINPAPREPERKEPSHEAHFTTLEEIEAGPMGKSNYAYPYPQGPEYSRVSAERGRVQGYRQQFYPGWQSYSAYPSTVSGVKEKSSSEKAGTGIDPSAFPTSSVDTYESRGDFLAEDTNVLKELLGMKKKSKGVPK